MARYLLDSSAFLWAKNNPGEIRQEALAEVEKAENTLFVSLASLWELTIKAANGRLVEFSRMMDAGPATLREGLARSGMTLLPIDLRHIATMYGLPRQHGDPFDRMIIAQAISEDLTVITRDGFFRRYPGLRVLAA